MQIGASTLYDGTVRPAAIAAAHARRGFRAIEIVFEHPHFLSDADIASLKKLKEQYGLSYSVHCPYITMLVGHKNASMRRATDALLKLSVDSAINLEATHYVMHGGRMPYYYAFLGFSEKQILRDWVKEVKPLVREAHNGGVRMVFENCLRSDFFGKARNHFAAARECGAGVCVDVAHAELTGQRAIYSKLKPDYVHVTDTLLKEKFDAHLGVGKGSIDFDFWVGALKKKGFNGKIILECVRGSDFVPSRKELLRSWNK